MSNSTLASRTGLALTRDEDRFGSMLAEHGFGFELVRDLTEAFGGFTARQRRQVICTANGFGRNRVAQSAYLRKVVPLAALVDEPGPDVVVKDHTANITLEETTHTVRRGRRCSCHSRGCLAEKAAAIIFA
jgi:hypothetical protein